MVSLWLGKSLRASGEWKNNGTEHQRECKFAYHYTRLHCSNESVAALPFPCIPVC